MAKTNSYNDLVSLNKRARQLKADNLARITELQEMENQINGSIEAAMVSGNQTKYGNGIDQLARIKTEIETLKRFCDKSEDRGGGAFYSDADVIEAWEAERDSFRASGLKSIAAIDKLLDKLMDEMIRFGRMKQDANKRREQFAALMIDGSKLPTLGPDIYVDTLINVAQKAKNESDRDALTTARFRDLF